MFGEMVLILSLPIDEKPATKFTSVTPGSSKKTAIPLHLVTSHLIPPRPLDQCCCPMHAGIRTEMAVFFEGLSKQSDVTTLNWGEGGMQVFSQ